MAKKLSRRNAIDPEQRRVALEKIAAVERRLGMVLPQDFKEFMVVQIFDDAPTRIVI